MCDITLKKLNQLCLILTIATVWLKFYQCQMSKRIMNKVFSCVDDCAIKNIIKALTAFM